MINIPNLTQNYNLSKPLGSERVDVNVLNKNSDILDTTLKSISIKSEAAYNHSNSAHARTDATKTEKSNINGNILINGVETEVYRHPLGRNPHGLIKSDIGLGNVDNTSDINKPVSIAQQEAINNAVKNKVDKVNGKGLSTNDYTTEEKNKLASINVSAEENQNAFSKVKVGNKTISSNEKMGTFELVAGNNVGLSVDSNTNKITISSSGGSGSSNASDISYDNTTSGLSSTEVQSAIDELNKDIVGEFSLLNRHIKLNQGTANWTAMDAITVDGNHITRLRVDAGTQLAYIFQNDVGTDVWTAQYIDVYENIENNTDILEYAKNMRGAHKIVRCYGSTTSPYGAVDNDFWYDIIKLNSNWIRITAYDVRTQSTYNINMKNGTWNVGGWNTLHTPTIYSSTEPSLNLVNGLIWIG